jgi:hypothetical protein
VLCDSFRVEIDHYITGGVAPAITFHAFSVKQMAESRYTCFLPSAFCLLPTAFYLLPSAYCGFTLAPSTG